MVKARPLLMVGVRAAPSRPAYATTNAGPAICGTTCSLRHTYAGDTSPRYLFIFRLLAMVRGSGALRPVLVPVLCL
jgi:hypothetical protein